MWHIILLNSSYCIFITENRAVRDVDSSLLTDGERKTLHIQYHKYKTITCILIDLIKVLYTISHKNR